MNLHLIAAKVVLGNTDSDEIVEIANESLDEIFGKSPEVESNSLIDLAISTDLSREDASGLLQRSFTELELVWPSFDAAASNLIAYWLRKITERQVTPRDGMQILYYEVFPLVEERKPSKKYVGDGVGLEQLFGLYHSYDDVHGIPNAGDVPSLSPEEAIREIDGRIIELGQEWIDSHCADIKL